MYNKRYPLHLRTYIKSLKKRMQEMEEGKEEKETLLKVVFHGVKTAVLEPKSTNYDESMAEFQTISALKQIIGQLTPNEFMNLFPVSKVYDGDRFEIKDYFYTTDYINSMDKDKPIGEENTTKFLFEYINDDIDRFSVKLAMCASDLRQYEGHLSMMEEFIAADGHDTPNTFKNAKGKAMYVRNGKPTVIEPIKTNKLELVK